MGWFSSSPAASKSDQHDLAKADRSERLELYKLMVEMADRVSQRRQAANSFYLSIDTLLITASAYIGTTAVSARVTLLVCFAGVMVSSLWVKAIESYKSLNAQKFDIINEVEKNLVVKPYTEEWERINHDIHGHKHRPFHETERLVPQVFIALFIFQALSVLPWSFLGDVMFALLVGEMD